jgi:hypothetical protein
LGSSVSPSIICFSAPMWCEPERMDCTKWRDYLSLTIWVNHCNWRMRNKSFPSSTCVTDAGPGRCESVHIQQPKGDSQCVSVTLHPKGTVQANLLLPFGIL